MKDFHYVYILVSEANHDLHYSGVTRNLKARLDQDKSWRG
jgi:predicted GIY-YIG superfamily endonuclease